jgi:hypothetical protein
VRCLALAALLALPASSEAVPDFGNARRIGNVDVFWDDAERTRFYFAPGEIAIARSSDGRPAVQLLQLRYSGMPDASGEAAPMHASTLTLGVELRGPDVQDLELARRFLRRLSGAPSIELRPIPIRSLDASLTFAPVDAGEPRALPGGHFEEAGSESAAGFWRERTYSVALDDHSSQILWEAIQRGLVALSVSYAFRAEGVIAPPKPELQAIGAAPVEGLEEALAELLADPEDGERELETRTVRAGAVELRVDAARWPDVLQRVDLDDRTPPGWALLRLYCFDFKDSLRPELFSKKVVIEAQAVNGRPVVVEVKFLRSRPELFARSVRFPIAVRVDRPYRFRVVEAQPDGSEQVGEWAERASWAQILDVTSYARPSAAEDQSGEGALAP